MYHIISYVKDDKISEQNIGNKARNLIELKKFGFNVPDFFVISSDINDISLIQKEIYEAFDNLDSGQVAVRSSAIGEDSVNKSFAGQYKTILFVSKENLMSAIEECRESLKTTYALSYSKGNIVNKMAVIIQKMVFANISGVAFSADPVRSDKSVIIIESVDGQCDSLVSGMVTPNHYVIKKNKMSERNIPDNIEMIAKITKEIENKFKYYIDIEWAIQDGVLYILQSRPITTLNRYLLIPPSWD